MKLHTKSAHHCDVIMRVLRFLSLELRVLVGFSCLTVLYPTVTIIIIVIIIISDGVDFVSTGKLNRKMGELRVPSALNPERCA